MTHRIRNRVLHAGAALATAALLAAPAAAQEDVVNVYNWSDYIAADTNPEFEEKFGIEVNYDVYDSNEVLEGKLMAGNTGYDVVVPSGSFFQRQIDAGIYQKLDKSMLDNLKHLDPEIMERAAVYDPGNQYGVPYMWGTTGIGYNVDMVKERLGEDAPTDSWELIFNPKYAKKLADCGITMLDAPTETMDIARKLLGYDPTSKDEEALEAAKELHKEIRPYVKYYHSSQYINDLANGDICVAMGWSGDVYIAQARGAEAAEPQSINYSIPKEGTVLWFDIFAIPRGAPHPDNAHKWINFMHEPEIAAQNVNYVWYASANQDALPMIDEEIKNNPSIYPPKSTIKNLWVDTSDPARFSRIQNRAWTEVKTGQ